MELEKPWDFLPPKFRVAVSRLGFAAPTPVQSACLPRALAGESFRAVAPTGTGKTLVYLLAAWQLRATPRGGAAKAALVLVPTRELAYQVSDMLAQLDPALREGTGLAIGGHGRDEQRAQLSRGWRTLIATPGRLLDLAEAGMSLQAVALVVLDEFDKLVSLGFQEQIASLLRRMPAGQRLLLSATDQEDQGGATAAAIKALGLDGLPSVQVEREAGTREMHEAFYLLRSEKKKSKLLLEELAATTGQAIVFVANRAKANHLHGLLRLRGVPARVLHGDLRQADRAAAYREFRDGSFRVLVASDLAARGLDLPEVDLIVNYDLPRNYRDYVHRTGRAARRGRAGKALSFAGPGEYLPMRNLEREYPGPLPYQPGYDGRERWLRDAKNIHDREARQVQRREFLRKEQGLTGE